MLSGALPGNGLVDARTAMTVQRLMEADFAARLIQIDQLGQPMKVRLGASATLIAG